MKWDGARDIIRYNWPFYLIAMVGWGLGVVALSVFGRSSVPGIGVLTAMTAAGFWVVTSIAVSWYVYDLSPLYRWDWIPPFIGGEPKRWASLHAGLDDVSSSLARLFPDADGQVVDIFDVRSMTEGSIRRARKQRTLRRSSVTLETSSRDMIFLVFAAHEQRDRDRRMKLFTEVYRALEPGGRLLIVEHLRDLPNFLAFGPGFLHFLPLGEWRRLAEESGFVRVREASITLFVRVFLLRKPG